MHTTTQSSSEYITSAINVLVCDFIEYEEDLIIGLITDEPQTKNLTDTLNAGDAFESFIRTQLVSSRLDADINFAASNVISNYKLNKAMASFAPFSSHDCQKVGFRNFTRLVEREAYKELCVDAFFDFFGSLELDSFSEINKSNITKEIRNRLDAWVYSGSVIPANKYKEIFNSLYVVTSGYGSKRKALSLEENKTLIFEDIFSLNTIVGNETDVLEFIKNSSSLDLSSHNPVATKLKDYLPDLGLLVNHELSTFQAALDEVNAKSGRAGIQELNLTTDAWFLSKDDTNSCIVTFYQWVYTGLTQWLESKAEQPLNYINGE